MTPDQAADPTRVSTSRALGRRGRAADLALAWAALAPIAALAGLAFVAGPQGQAQAHTLAAVWAGALLCFFAGVRRGLSFSEAQGAQRSELASFLVMFAAGVLTCALRSPGLGAAGLLGVALADVAAARAGEAPPYFARLRPVQLGLGALGLLALAVRTGA